MPSGANTGKRFYNREPKAEEITYCYWCGDGPRLDWQPGCASCGRLAAMEDRLDRKHKKQVKTGSQPTAPRPAPTTTRDPTTTASRASILAECPTVHDPSQSLKLCYGVNLTPASLSPHPDPTLDSYAQQSLNPANVHQAVSTNDTITCRQDFPGGQLGSDAPSESQEHPAPASHAVPEELATPNTTPSAYRDAGSTARPFSGRTDAIQLLRSSVLPEKGNPPVPNPRSASKVRKHPAEPSHTAGTPRSKRAKVLKFACPFRKRNPIRYSDNTCTHGFSRICDVKQHLRRQHMSYICRRCGTEFGKEETLDEHYQQEEPCKRIPEKDHQDPRGITPKQESRLQRRADSKTDDKEQWGVMWRIVFPKYADPVPSPFVSDSEEADAAFEFSHIHGSQIARTIPALRNVPEADIKTFIEHLRNAYVSEHSQDTPPSMESPGSEDDSPQGEASPEPILEPVLTKGQLPEVQDKPVTKMIPPIALAVDGMDSDAHLGILPNNMDFDPNCFQQDINNWDDFSSQPFLANMTAFPSFWTGPNQVNIQEPSSISRMPAMDCSPMPAGTHSHIQNTKAANQQNAESSNNEEPNQERA